MVCIHLANENRVVSSVEANPEQRTPSKVFLSTEHATLRSPAGQRDLSLLQSAQTGCGAHQAAYRSLPRARSLMQSDWS